MPQLTPLSQNRLKYLKKLQKGKYRRQYGMYICEGWRLFEAAIHRHAGKISEVILSDSFLDTNLRDRFFQYVKASGTPVFQTSVKEMKILSSEIAPQGILFTMPLPAGSNPPDSRITDPLVLYLEEISDPGNLGTIIRTAVWFGIKTIFLSHGAVDPYNPKVVRSSAGAIFDAEIYEDVSFSHLRKSLGTAGYKFIATTPRNGAELTSWKPITRSVIMFGREAEGLSGSLQSGADVRITIPQSGPAESLNLGVSAGIILFHATQALKQ